MNKVLFLCLLSVATLHAESNATAPAVAAMNPGPAATMVPTLQSTDRSNLSRSEPVQTPPYPTMPVNQGRLSNYYPTTPYYSNPTPYSSYNIPPPSSIYPYSNGPQATWQGNTQYSSQWQPSQVPVYQSPSPAPWRNPRVSYPWQQPQQSYQSSMYPLPQPPRPLQYSPPPPLYQLPPRAPLPSPPIAQQYPPPPVPPATSYSPQPQSPLPQPYGLVFSMDRIRQIFSAVDKDGNGKVCLPEFTKFINEKGFGFTPDEITDFFNVFDKDRSGKVCLTEFNRFMTLPKPSIDAINKVIDKIPVDSTKDGSTTAADMNSNHGAV